MLYILTNKNINFLLFRSSSSTSSSSPKRGEMINNCVLCFGNHLFGECPALGLALGEKKAFFCPMIRTKLDTSALK